MIGSTKDGLLVRAADYENLVKQQDYISIQILLGDPVVEGVFWRLPFVAILKTTFRSVSDELKNRVCVSNEVKQEQAQFNGRRLFIRKIGF